MVDGSHLETGLIPDETGRLECDTVLAKFLIWDLVPNMPTWGWAGMKEKQI